MSSADAVSAARDGPAGPGATTGSSWTQSERYLGSSVRRSFATRMLTASVCHAARATGSAVVDATLLARTASALSAPSSLRCGQRMMPCRRHTFLIADLPRQEPRSMSMSM
jgi:hypothetical protein